LPVVALRDGGGASGSTAGLPAELGGLPSLESSRDEHEKLRERIMGLEDSLQRLGRESLERAKLGMEKLAEKYFPKVKQYEAMSMATPPASALAAGGQGPLLRVSPMAVKVVGPMPTVGAQMLPGAAIRTSLSPPRTTASRLASPRHVAGHCSPAAAAPKAAGPVSPTTGGAVWPGQAVA